MRSTPCLVPVEFMRILIDTHVLLWSALSPHILPPLLAQMIDDKANAIFVSSASIWEVAIKSGINRPDFQVDARELARSCWAAGFNELPISATHAQGVANLPPIHKDPFDRMLVAQAIAEQLLLVTRDITIGLYPGPIRLF